MQLCGNQHEFCFDSRISTFWHLNQTTCTTARRYQPHLFHCELVNVHCKFPVCQSQDDAGGLGRLCLYLSRGLRVQTNDTLHQITTHFRIIWIFAKSYWAVIGFIWEGKLTSFIPSCIYVSPAGFTSRKRFRPSSISYLKTQNKWLTFWSARALRRWHQVALVIKRKREAVSPWDFLRWGTVTMEAALHFKIVTEEC